MTANLGYLFWRALACLMLILGMGVYFLGEDKGAGAMGVALGAWMYCISESYK